MAEEPFDVRTVYNDRGTVAGYVWHRPGRPPWSAILAGYCECCAPEKLLGKSFPDLATAAAAVIAGLKAGSEFASVLRAIAWTIWCDPMAEHGPRLVLEHQPRRCRMKEEAEMGADKSHAETPNEFLHRELGEFAARCALRGVPVSAFGSALLGCAIHAIIAKEGKEKANQIVATLTRRYFEMEPQVTAFMGEGCPTRENLKMPRNSRNLLRGPGLARGRGRIQRGSWDALVFANGAATTTQVLDQVYFDKRARGRWLRNGGWYQLARRRLDEIADRVGRSTGPGRPWLWRLRPGHAPPGCWDGWCDENGDPWPVGKRR
jgi:hypothetical protein